MPAQGILLTSEDSAKYLAGNAIVCADNIDVLNALPDGSVDLIYLDPPFQSASHYVAIFGDKGQVDQQLKDIWKWTTQTENTFTRRIPRGGPGGALLNALQGIRLQTGPPFSMAAYCVFMGRRLLEMHRILKPTGTLYLHCDYHAGHFLRILLDAIFGAQNLIDVIAWNYGTPSGGRTSGKKPVKAHDTLLVYAKRYGKHTYNRQYTPYNEKYVKNWFRHIDEDGRYYQTRSRKGKIVRQYLDQSPGVPLSNVWSDIMQLYGSSGWFPTTQGEYIGYPTQKPLALLERIIRASSNEGDLVLDPFCGCGTAVDAAAKLGRNYLGVDISAIAVRVMEQRLTSRGATATPAVYGLDWGEWEWEEFERMALRSRDEAEDNVPGWAWAEDKVAGLLNAVPNSKKTGDGGVDARYYGAAGEEIPIQVKMHRRPVGRPDMDKLLGAQTAMKNRGVYAPMSLTPAAPQRCRMRMQGVPCDSFRAPPKSVSATRPPFVPRTPRAAFVSYLRPEVPTRDERTTPSYATLSGGGSIKRLQAAPIFVRIEGQSWTVSLQARDARKKRATRNESTRIPPPQHAPDAPGAA